jgi:riboflavin kinase/FMN adenylyltransferase
LLPSAFNSLALAAAALPPDRPLHLAIGMFDGVHLGHRAVLESALAAARHDAGLAAVLTFWPHPSRLFHPQSPTPQLMAPGLKTRLLLDLQADAVITQSFDAAFARVAADEFLPLLKQYFPGLVAVHVGENWRFGRGRRGDVALLAAEARKHGLTIVSLPRVSHEGKPISSSRIRACLEVGEIEQANAMLGCAYFYEGQVVSGRQLGRTLGFPTLNLTWGAELAPRFGVYAVRVNGAKTPGPLPGVANFGLRPTVELAIAPLLEIHLLSACPFGTGDGLKVEWLHFLRPEQKFTGVDELRAQIGRDCALAEKFFGSGSQDFSLR